MFKKLSVALVAMSLVVVAHPASAQMMCWGGPCKIIPDLKDQITIKSTDGKKVFATNGNSYPVPKPKEVSVDGSQVAPEALKPDMVCEVNRGTAFRPKNIFTCKTS